MRTRIVLTSMAVIAAGLVAASSAATATGDGAQAEQAGTEVGTNKTTGPALRGGAVILGEPGDGGTSCFFPTPFGVMSDVEDPAHGTLTAPFDGVLTTYSTFANSTAGQVRVLVLTEGADATHKVLVGKSEKRTVTPDILNTFPVRVAMQAGQQLGLGLTATGMSCGTVHAGSPGVLRAAGPFDADTTTDFAYHASVQTTVTPSISAMLEPDIDLDGFGDVTQDSCRQSAATQDDCPPPETVVTKKPKTTSHKRKAKIRFGSATGTTFTCRVDGKPTRSCTSPFKKRFTYGNHTVRITAFSVFGIADPSPAVVKFQVTRPA